MVIRFRAALARLAVAGALFLPCPAPVLGVTATVGNGLTTKALNSLGGPTTDTLAAALAGPGVTVSNVTYKGAWEQAGLVHLVDPAVISFNDGVILSSGNIADVIGPNKSESITGDMATWPGPVGTSGAADSALTALIASTQTVNPMTYDAAVLEFDFVPQATPIYFTYVFGSDEYLEWVNLYNDVFAFWVNGTNCATVPSPDGTTAVSIDTINSVVNPSLYRDNSFLNPPANPINVEPDGLSVELICRADVTPGVVNHMKLAIADTSDQVLDSVVILKSGTLSTTPPESCNDGIDNNGNSLVDMNDDFCTGTTTPPPTTGGSGIGSDSTPPPFTGNEGTPILLDAGALGMPLTAATLSTSWDVHGINGTTATCRVLDPSGNDITSGRQVVSGGQIPLAWAICPNEGEYVARVDGWDAYVGGGSEFDDDIDFFVHNAPPAVEIDTAISSTSVVVGETASLIAWVTDPGPNDVVACRVKWGDGATSTATPDANGVCSATHVFGAPATVLATITATDDAGDSSAALLEIAVTGGSQSQQIAWTSAPPASAAYGMTFTVAATGGASGNPLVFGASGGCSNVGGTFSMTSGTTTCAITVDQAGGGGFTAAPTLSATVGATTRPIAVAADPISKLWGDADPSLSWHVTSGSLVAGDAFAGSLSRFPGEALGGYPISLGTLSAGANYALSFSGATFTITGVAPAVTSQPASVTVAAGSAASFSASAWGKPTPSVQWQVLPVGGAWANITGATSTTYTFTVAATDSGKQYRAVFSNGVSPAATTSAATLTVPPTPTITRLSPTSGGVGTSVTVTGTNFTGATAVTFSNGIAARFTVISATSIVTSVPTGSITGAIRITTPGGTASSGSFTVGATPVAPTVTSFSPTSGAVGTIVTISGTNLAGANAMRIGTATVTSGWTVRSATSLTVAVPAGGGSGTIAVTTDGGTGTSSGSFTVKAATSLSYTGPASATRNTAFTLSAKLTSGTAALAGMTVTFALGGKSYTATTNASGVASVSATAPKNAGAYSITVTYAGNATYASATTTAPFTAL